MQGLMYFPKRYGMSKTENCVFCEKQAIVKNKQGLLVCNEHRDSILPDIRCVCGHYLELKVGKFGPYFYCISCGNLNLKKGLDILENMQEREKVKVAKEKQKTVSDEGKYPGFDYGVD
jgi:hypothetical protein